MTQALPPPTQPIGERINVVAPAPPPDIVQEGDLVPSGRVVVTALVGVLVVAVAIVVVIGLEQPPAHARTKAAPALLHGVHQTPIAGPSFAEALRAKQNAALHTTSDVDAKTAFGTISIDDAKRIYVAQHANTQNKQNKQQENER